MTCPVLLKLIGVLPLTSVKGGFNSRPVVGLGLSGGFQAYQWRTDKAYHIIFFWCSRDEKAYFLRH